MILFVGPHKCLKTLFLKLLFTFDFLDFNSLIFIFYKHFLKYLYRLSSKYIFTFFLLSLRLKSLEIKNNKKNKAIHESTILKSSIQHIFIQN